ncbi:hypothetical protein [Ancylobacter terrae]|uniref:hypothetical protein n=1 Tax=Ancylobacter sp. sgz301288 TaxID=3342077 RepID=UPI00385D1961
MKRYSAVKIALILFAFVWVILIFGGLSVFPLRSKYISQWREHHEMQIKKLSHSRSGDSLATMYEYVCMTQSDYLNMLEAAIIIGLLPALFILIGISLSAVRKQ